MKVTMKMKMFKSQKTIIQAIKKVTRKLLIFFPVKILVMNGYLKSYETECFIREQPTRDVLRKQKCSAKTCSGFSFSALMAKNLKNTCEGVYF